MSIVYRFAKRCLDLGVSSATLLVAAPVLVPTAFAIRATMGSPVLFRQQRPGYKGEPFEILKFRTMRNLRPGEDIVSSDGNRLTQLGRLLRQTSIDELPTLLNVLKGDMSLVGPRPLLMRYLPRYNAQQNRRHDVKPGITGWAQINGRNAIDWPKKFSYDVWYVEHRSLRLDAKILVKTALKVLVRDGISSAEHVTMPEFMGNE